MKVYNDYYEPEWHLNAQKGTVESVSKIEEGIHDETRCPSCNGPRIKCNVCVICLLKTLGGEGSIR